MERYLCVQARMCVVLSYNSVTNSLFMPCHGHQQIKPSEVVKYVITSAFDAMSASVSSFDLEWKKKRIHDMPNAQTNRKILHFWFLFTFLFSC